MEKINNEFPIESDIQVNQNELKLYTKILSNHNKIIIRINDNINEIYTKSYYKIMSLGFLYPEENILFTLNEDEEKDDYSSINPSGFVQREYPNIVPGKYLYHRCHLIGWSIGGLECSLIHMFLFLLFCQ